MPWRRGSASRWQDSDQPPLPLKLVGALFWTPDAVNTASRQASFGRTAYLPMQDACRSSSRSPDGVTGGERTADVIARTPMTLMRLSRDAYTRYLAHLVDVEGQITRTALRRARETLKIVSTDREGNP